MKKKICAIFSQPSFYRKSIFKKIDEYYQCDWHFSTEDGGVKRFNPEIFRTVTIHKFHKLGRFCWMSGINSLLSKRENETFLMLGCSVDLSCWLFFIRKKLFYPGKKIYVWGHGWYGKETILESTIKKFLFRCVDGIFVYGNWAKKLMVLNGIPDEKIFVIHNSLNYDEQLELRKSNLKSSIFREHFNNNYPNIIVIGRLTYRKKLDMLFKSMSLLKKKNILFNVTLVGDGEAYKYLSEQAELFCLSENIWFYGASYSEETNAMLMFNADICVTPGDIGLTAIHALMFGVPVITHDDFIHQGPEFEAITPNVTGYYFRHNDVHSLSDVLASWFENHTDRDKVRSDCYNEIDTWWNPYFQIDLINNVLL